jgi:hypothetical protein
MDRRCLRIYNRKDPCVVDTPVSTILYRANCRSIPASGYISCYAAWKIRLNLLNLEAGLGTRGRGSNQLTLVLFALLIQISNL